MAANMLPQMTTGYDDSAKWKIEHSGRVELAVAKTTIGFFCAFSIIAVAGRLTVRLALRRRLYLDDLTLLFAFACLMAATGVMYKFQWIIYVLNTMKYDPTVPISIRDIEYIMNAQAINYSLMALMWSAICLVKLCFLASFKVLIKNVSKSITIWFWGTVILVMAVWAFLVAVPWITCPYSGTKLLQHCTPEPPFSRNVASNWTSFATDFVTDVMIVAIPIYILRNVQIKLSQKLSIASFLCLSVVIIIVSLLRSATARYKGFGDYTMMYLLIYIEACISIIMASISAYRAVFTQAKKLRQSDQQQKLLPLPRQPAAYRHDVELGSPNTLYYQGDQYHPSYRSKTSGRSNQIEAANGTDFADYPHIESPKMNTVLSFIRGVGRSRNVSTMRSNVELSVSDGSTYHPGRDGMVYPKVSTVKDNMTGQSQDS